MPTQIEVTVVDGVATLRLISANGLHILSLETLDDLQAALEPLSLRSDIVALVLTGAGQRAFSAGANLVDLSSLDHEGALAFAARGQGVAQAIARFPVPTIAALGASAYGGGIELALACDFRLAEPGIRLHYQAAKLGLLPGWGGTQRLPRLVGPARAKRMMLASDPLTSEEALAWGLVDEVAPLEPLLGRWVARLRDADRGALVQIKRAIDLAVVADFAGEREALAACFSTDRTPALIRAWLELA